MNLSISDSDTSHARAVFPVAVLAATTVVLAVLIAVTEPLAEDGIRRLSPFRYQMLLAERAASAVRVLALGDSQAGFGFLSPDTRARSIAFPGETIPEMTLKARHILAKFPAVAVVALQAQPHMFFQHRDAPPKPAYVELEKGRGVFHPFEHALQQFDPCCRSGMPRIVFSHFFRLPLPEPVPEIGQNGYLIYPLNAAPPGTRVEQAEREIRSYGSTTPVPQLREAFEQLIADLRAAQLHVVLVRYPFSPEYLALMPADALVEADTFVKSLSRKHQLALCGTWDAYTDSKLFFNADHLNQEGARVYWPTIAHCLAPYLPDISSEAVSASHTSG